MFLYTVSYIAAPGYLREDLVEGSASKDMTDGRSGNRERESHISLTFAILQCCCLGCHLCCWDVMLCCLCQYCGSYFVHILSIFLVCPMLSVC